jgi:predicted small lipoprotein YifL
MKKLITLAPPLVLVLSLAACGGNGNSSVPSGSDGSGTDAPPSSQGGDDAAPSGNNGGTTEERPKNEFTALIHKPAFGELYNFLQAGAMGNS